MSAHDAGDVLCECAACVAEDLALLTNHPDPLGQIAESIHEETPMSTWPDPDRPASVTEMRPRPAAPDPMEAVHELARRQAGEWQRLVITLPPGPAGDRATTAFYVVSEWSRR